MYGELASVKEVVDLSSQEALDRAEVFLTQQGYRIAQRTDITVTADRRQKQGMFGHSLLNLTVAAQPQAQGGVRIQVRGNDRQGVQARQAEWKEWADGLPKKVSYGQGRKRTMRRPAPRRSHVLKKKIAELQEQLQKTLIEEGQQPGNKDAGSLTRTAGQTGPKSAKLESRKQRQGSNDPVSTQPAGSKDVSEETSNVLDLNSYFASRATPKRASSEEVMSSKVVEAQSFRLVNGDGEIRAVLTVDEDSPYLGLWDESGTIRAMMNAKEDSVNVGLADSSGHLRVRMAVGSEDSPALDFVDEDQGLRLRVTMEEGGSPSMTFVDANGRPRAALKEDPQGRHLLGFVDENGGTRATFHMDRDGTPKLVFRDTSGGIRALLTVEALGTPTFGLFDDGEALRAAFMLGEEGGPTLILSDHDGAPRAYLSIRPDGSPHLTLLDRMGNVSWQTP